jgi:hypothetical protein
MENVFDDIKGQHVENKRTICEVHRQLYDLLVLGLKGKDDELLAKVVPLLQEAYIDGIKIVKKLVENKMSELDWEENTNIEEVKRLRLLRIELSRMENIFS